MLAGDGTPEELAHELVALALRGEARDNVAVVVSAVAGERPPIAPAARRARIAGVTDDLARPDLQALVAFGQRAALAVGVQPPSAEGLLDFFDALLFRGPPDGREAWPGFVAGLILEVELRDFVLAHLETWLERGCGRELRFVELDRELVLVLETALFGRALSEPGSTA